MGDFLLQMMGLHEHLEEVIQIPLVGMIFYFYSTSSGRYPLFYLTIYPFGDDTFQFPPCTGSVWARLFKACVMLTEHLKTSTFTDRSISRNLMMQVDIYH